MDCLDRQSLSQIQAFAHTIVCHSLSSSIHFHRLSCRKILKLPYVNDHLIVYLKSIEDAPLKEIFEEEMLHLSEDPDTDEDEDG